MVEEFSDLAQRPGRQMAAPFRCGLAKFAPAEAVGAAPVAAPGEDWETAALACRAADAGWASASVPLAELPGTMRRLALSLGTPAAGRNGRLQEVIAPRRRSEAHPRSLSAAHGLDALPLHTEMSYRPRPCRYVILGCLNADEHAAATRLLNWRELDFGPDLCVEMASAPMLVRSGRRSFYATLLPACASYLRYDGECVQAIDRRGASLLSLVGAVVAGTSVTLHRWSVGTILLIDNWSALHGRAPARDVSDRRLLRILVDA